MSEQLHAPGPCALCGRDPAAGLAGIGDDWYCHGDLDPEPTCYMRAQWSAERTAEPGSVIGFEISAKLPDPEILALLRKFDSAP